MPVDPQIANGLIPFGEGVVRSMAMGAELADRRRQTDLYANQLAQQAENQQYGRQQAEQEAEKARQLEDIRRTYAAAKAGVPGALEYAYGNILEQFPRFAEIPDADKPAKALELMEGALGITPENAGDGIKIGQYNPGDYTPQTWARFVQTRDPAVLERQYAPQQPPSPIFVNTPALGAGIYNKQTGQPIQIFSTPEEESAAAARRAAEEAAAKTSATKRQEAAADLPRIEANATDMLNVLTQLKESPGLRYVFGSYSLAPIVPGTPQADAAAIWEQVQGKAFLEAFNTLKGSGQITEKEGEKATAAITRLSNRRQSLGSAVKAIKELEEVVKATKTAAERKAVDSSAPAQGVPTGSPRMRFDQYGNPIR